MPSRIGSPKHNHFEYQLRIEYYCNYIYLKALPLLLYIMMSFVSCLRKVTFSPTAHITDKDKCDSENIDEDNDDLSCDEVFSCNIQPSEMRSSRCSFVCTDIDHIDIPELSLPPPAMDNSNNQHNIVTDEDDNGVNSVFDCYSPVSRSISIRAGSISLDSSIFDQLVKNSNSNFIREVLLHDETSMDAVWSDEDDRMLNSKALAVDAVNIEIDNVESNVATTTDPSLTGKDECDCDETTASDLSSSTSTESDESTPTKSAEHRGHKRTRSASAPHEKRIKIKNKAGMTSITVFANKFIRTIDRSFTREDLSQYMIDNVPNYSAHIAKIERKLYDIINVAVATGFIIKYDKQCIRETLRGLTTTKRITYYCKPGSMLEMTAELESQKAEAEAIIADKKILLLHKCRQFANMQRVGSVGSSATAIPKEVRVLLNAKLITSEQPICVEAIDEVDRKGTMLSSTQPLIVHGMQEIADAFTQKYVRKT